MEIKKRSYKVALITIGVHSLYFFMFPTSLNLKNVPKKTQKLHVVTKEIIPPRAKAETIVKTQLDTDKVKVSKQKISTSSFLPESSPPKSSSPKKTIKKVPTKKKSKTTPKAKPQIKPKAKPKTTTTPKSTKSVRGKLEKNVAEIQAKNPKKKVEGIKKTAPSSTDSQTSEKEAKHSYLQKISTQLRGWLTLPEKGAVKLTITVQANGKIVNIVPLSNESEKNLEYLKCVLTSLQLPAFEENKEITFTITFCDD